MLLGIAELVGSRIVHARTQPKRIRIQHGVTWINHFELTATPIQMRSAADTRHLLLLHHLRVALNSLLVETTLGGHPLRSLLLLFELWRVLPLHMVGRRIGAVGIGVGVVEHGSGVLGIVLLLCTHGVNLGRQSSAGNKRRVNLPSWSMCFWKGEG